MLNAIRVEQLIAELGDPNKQRRAAYILVSLGKYVVHDLLEGMNGQSEEVLFSIAAVIVQIGPQAVEALIKALEWRTDPACQRIMIEILGEIGDVRAIKPLREILAADDQNLNCAVVDALLSISCQQLRFMLQTKPLLSIAN